jgi:septal ring factor EnvC (AmiA/AmiB activator)
MDQTALVYRTAEETCSRPPQPAHLIEALPSTRSLSRKKGRRALFWSMGGTLLSAVGFVALALFEQYNGMLTELRNDLKHFNETSSDYVKKDSIQRLREHVLECIKDLNVVTAARTQTEQELRASERAREEMAREVQRMRERLAYLEGRHSAVPNSNSPAAVSRPGRTPEEP